MNEELPQVRLDLAGREFIATPLNSHLYTFIGKTLLNTGEVIENSSRNHVFLQTDESETFGTYIFQTEIVQQLGVIMLQTGFHCDINRREIPQCDEDAYQRYISQQIEEVEDYFPEDWT